jgi:prophage regulatory protein
MVTYEFLLPSEVQEITRLRDPTRRRMEKRGLFPRRIRIAPRRVAWRNAEIKAWIEDPEGWSTRQRRRDSEPCRDDLAEDL